MQSSPPGTCGEESENQENYRETEPSLGCRLTKLTLVPRPAGRPWADSQRGRVSTKIDPLPRLQDPGPPPMMRPAPWKEVKWNVAVCIRTISR